MRLQAFSLLFLALCGHLGASPSDKIAQDDAELHHAITAELSPTNPAPLTFDNPHHAPLLSYSTPVWTYYPQLAMAHPNPPRNAREPIMVDMRAVQTSYAPEASRSASPHAGTPRSQPNQHGAGSSLRGRRRGRS